MKMKSKQIILHALNIKQLESLKDNGFESFSEECGYIAPQTDFDIDIEKIFDNCCDKKKLDRYIWYTLWLIVERTEKKIIGYCMLNGEKNEVNEDSFNVFFNEQYYSPERYKEAVEAVSSWALSSGVYFLQTNCPAENVELKQVLADCGFKPVSEAEGVIVFEKEKPKTYWVSIYMCLGLSLGVCFGAPQSKYAIGMIFGVGIGAAVGLIMDAQDKKEREKRGNSL